MYACAYPENYLVWTISETTFYDFNYVTPKTEDKNTHNKQQQSFSTHKNTPATPQNNHANKKHAFPSSSTASCPIEPCLWHPFPTLRQGCESQRPAWRGLVTDKKGWQDFGFIDPKVRNPYDTRYGCRPIHNIWTFTYASNNFYDVLGYHALTSINILYIYSMWHGNYTKKGSKSNGRWFKSCQEGCLWLFPGFL